MTYKATYYSEQGSVIEVKDLPLADVQLYTPDLMIGGNLPSVCSTDDRSKLAQSLDCLIDYCTLFGFVKDEVVVRQRDAFDSKATLDHWQLCSVTCGWIKFLKYKLSAFMSAHLGGELPVCPFEQGSDKPTQLAGGSLGRFMKLIMAGPRAREFATGVLYLKKGFPRPDKLALEKAIQDTKKVLTSTKAVPSSMYTTMGRTHVEVKRTVKEIFGRSLFTDARYFHPYAPSIKANYVDSRSKYGTFGTLKDLGIIVDMVYSGFGPKHPFTQDVDKLYADCLIENNNKSEEIEDEENLDFIVNPVLRDRVNSIYREVYEKARLLAVQEKADVKLVALAEALKVRVISKGPPLTYFVLKPVQKFLHSIMRKQRCFSLIGRGAVTPEFLTEVFGKADGLFHSLDYQSATDLLNPEISNLIVDEICDTVGLADDIRLLFKKALTGHLVEGEPQLWGQLMGSVVSFIVLCIANATVIRQAYELSTGIERTLSDLPIVVNGDDGLVRAPLDFLAKWQDIAALVGLQPSVGKVYTHSVYVNINSTSFNFRADKRDFELIPYVNMGLVNGQTRSGPSVSRSDVVDNTEGLSLGSRHKALMESCPRDLRFAVHELFLLRNMKLLQSLRLPWYIPESLGGVGLLPQVRILNSDDFDEISREYYTTSSGHVCGPTKLDVMIALSIRDKVHRSFPVKLIPASQPIQARAIWQRRVSNRDTLKARVKDTDMAFLDMCTYYLTPSLCMAQISDLSREACLHRNERAWGSLIQFWDKEVVRQEHTLFLDTY
jgi:hypothetical protein